MDQQSYPFMTTGKTIALTRRTLVGKVMFLLFNMLSRFVMVVFPRGNVFNFMAAVTVCSDFGATKYKMSLFLLFPFFLPWSDETRCHKSYFFNVDFKPAFSLSSFTIIKRLFSSSSVSAIRVLSSAYHSISLDNLDSSLWFIQLGISHNALCI